MLAAGPIPFISIGLLASYKKVAGCTESDGTFVVKSTSNTRQVSPGLEAAYTLNAGGTRFEPFAKLEFIYDLKDPVNNDTRAYDVGGGVHLGKTGSGVSGAVEGKIQLVRAGCRKYSFSAMLAYSFAFDPEAGTNPSILKPFVKSRFLRALHGLSNPDCITFTAQGT